MDAIGGYFELELHRGEHYHQGAIRLNSGQNCFEYILRARRYKKVYMPYYTCSVMFGVLNKLGVEITYYPINEQLEPDYIPQLQTLEAFLYTNYFGLKQRCVEQLAEKYGKQLIVDNAQAFYAKPIAGIDTFYSPRKFFGVPDGGYLYTDVALNDEFPQAESLQRMTHLLKRIEQGAEAGYEDYQRAETTLNGRPIERMSKITDALLCSIDYETIAQCRRKNYQMLAEQLKDKNLMHLSLEEDAVPMVYPYLEENGAEIRNALLQHRIYTATYWLNVIALNNGSLEERLAMNMVPLPIDQRYSEVMKRIINL